MTRNQRTGNENQATSSSFSDTSVSEPAFVERIMGRYRLIEPLGQGGMGTVFRALDTLLDREIALKIPKIPANSRNAAQWLNRFHREAKIAAGFTHGNLCPIYDVSNHEGTHFLTMPLIPGESLAARLKNVKRFAPKEAARLVIRLADAMHFAHSAGVLHRDLKPANIMLRPPNDDPMIMDFGLAVSDMPGSPRLTAQGAFLGTPAYCSPEHLIGNHLEAGPGSDVYSLGVILYELLTGRLPFLAKPGASLSALKSLAVVPPSELSKEVPKEYDMICLRALARSARDRFVSMYDLARSLESALESLEPRSTISPILTTVPRKRRRWLMPAGIVSSLLIAWIAYLIFDGRLPKRLLRWGAIDSNTGRSLDSPSSLPPLSERFVANTIWKGKFYFRPLPDGTPVDLNGDVILTVNTRNGANFSGTYRSEGRYEWVVEGTLANDEVRWKFVKAIIDAEHGTVVGFCECRLKDEKGTLVGEFINRQMQMAADLRLQLVK